MSGPSTAELVNAAARAASRASRLPPRFERMRLLAATHFVREDATEVERARVVLGGEPLRVACVRHGWATGTFVVSVGGEPAVAYEGSFGED